MLFVHTEGEPDVLWTETGEMMIASPSWPEEIGVLGEERVLTLLGSLVGSSRLPVPGLINRASRIYDNNFTGIILPEGAVETTRDGSRFWDEVIDLDTEGYSNRVTQTQVWGSPTACRMENPPFAGVSREVAELLL